MKIDKEARRQLAITNAKHPPILTKVPLAEWPKSHFDPKRIEVWRSNKFLAQVFDEEHAMRVSVCRVELNRSGQAADAISWDDLQEIKRQIGRCSLWAVEVYPADLDLVYVANMRHLWLLREAPPFAWRRAADIEVSVTPKIGGKT